MFLFSFTDIPSQIGIQKSTTLTNFRSPIHVPFWKFQSALLPSYKNIIFTTPTPQLITVEKLIGKSRDILISNEKNFNEHISFRAYLISRKKDASPSLVLLSSTPRINLSWKHRIFVAPGIESKRKKNKEKITYDFSAFVEITPENGIICAVLCGAIISENNVIMCSPHKHSSTFFSSLSTYFCRKNHASTSRPCIIYPIVSSQGGKLYRL